MGILEEIRNIIKLKDKYTPLALNDKFKHAVINCEMAKRGNSGILTTSLASILKELRDMSTLNNTPAESYKDLVADYKGLKIGLDNKEVNCEKEVEKLYSRNY